MVSRRAGSWALLCSLLCAYVALVGGRAHAAAEGPKPPTPPEVPSAATPKVPAEEKSKTADKAPPPAKPEVKPTMANPAAGQVPPASPEDGSSQAQAGPAPATENERPPAPEPRSRRAARAPRKDPSPPSLTLEALRSEISNSPAEIEKNNLLQEREKLNELVSALDVAQKQLRTDTERLTAFLEEAKKQNEAKQTKEEEKNALAAAAPPPAPGKQEPSGPSPIEVLSKAMRGMKPAQAAAIAERVPLSLAADVMQKMPARDAGRVMGLMEPTRAAELAAEIASRDEAKTKGKR